MFLSLSYPRKLVDRTINTSWQIELKKQIATSLYDDNAQHTEETEQNPGYFDTLNVPYIERLSNDLRHINIGVTFRKGRTL